MTSRETRAYLSMSGGRYMPCGQSFQACEMGSALRTPNVRASYEAVATTPRPRPPLGSAPTMTGLPRSSGRSRCSTAA